MKAEINMYAACDRAIKSMNREILRMFGQLKMAKWDEVQIIRVVTETYQKSAKKARNHYYEVGFEAYLLALAICGVDHRKAQRMAEKAITDEWVEMVLTQTDPVTLYRFDTETERKAMRLAEALEEARDRNLEIDRAIRYWSRQLGQYAINVTDYAETKAFEDAKIEMAEWVTQKDERVCVECHALDGRVFPVDEFPVKPHIGCRCRKRPVFR